MCGINGILRLDTHRSPIDRAELVRTRDAMQTRGPDGTGEWISPNGQVGFGHRRLAIIDLSEGSAQPFQRTGGRFTIVFNGEIYNYEELRTQLEKRGQVFVSSGDTEVLLALYECFGIDAFRQARGMFSVAIWDQHEQTLVLARDPYGIKPLYYTTEGGYLRFASQARALLASEQISDAISMAGAVGFLLWGSVPEPHTLWQSIAPVPAGHTIMIKDGQVGTPLRYYHPGAYSVSGLDLTAAVSESVSAHLIADVPVAVFLSAGIDSAVIAACATRHSRTPITTLTVTFDDLLGTEDDEGPQARQIAQALGTRHIETRVTKDSFPDLWERAMRYMDQPSIDGFNTLVISRAAHEAGFKVVMSGLGGDELLGGYSTFRRVPRLRKIAAFGRIPAVAPLWAVVAPRAFPGKPRFREMFRSTTLEGAYWLSRGLFGPGEIGNILDRDFVREGFAQYDMEATLHASHTIAHFDNVPMTERDWYSIHMMESSQYMANQLLRDCDWASMAFSLELRVPLVDARLREQVLFHKPSQRSTITKSQAMRSVAPELPDSVWTRPKTGFNIPVQQLLKGSKPASKGLGSRALALQILRAFGVPLANSAAPHAVNERRTL